MNEQPPRAARRRLIDDLQALSESLGDGAPASTPPPTPAPAPTSVQPLLDLGASNVRFALQGPGGEPERAMRLPVGAQPDLLSAIRWYLNETGARPSAGAFAVASAISGREG